MQPRRELVALGGDLSQPCFQLDDPPDRGQRHALVRHRRDLLDDADLHPGVAALAAGRALRGDDLELVDAAQEGLLDREHLRDLPNSEQRDVLVLEALHGSPPSGNAKRPAVRIAPPAACDARQLISWPAPCWYRPRSCGAWPPRGPGCGS